MGYYENHNYMLRWDHNNRKELESLIDKRLPPIEEYINRLGYSKTDAQKSRDQKLQEDTECMVSLQASLRNCIKAFIHPEAIEELMKGYLDELRDIHKTEKKHKEHLNATRS